jgi:hypothetical protein
MKLDVEKVTQGDFKKSVRRSTSVSWNESAHEIPMPVNTLRKAPRSANKALLHPDYPPYTNPFWPKSTLALLC